MTKDIKLAGFNYTKILVEKEKEFSGELKISPNINIKNIEKHNSENSKNNFLKVEFKFGVEYTNLGKIDLEGVMFLIVDSKIQKEVLDSWKNKKLEGNINLLILNIIMQKASLKALELEDEMGLPPHVQLPRLQLNKQE